MDESPSAEAPPEAPEILNFEQAKHLSHQGWLPFDLPEDLNAEIFDLIACASNFFDKAHDKKLQLYPPKRGTESGFYHVPDEKEYVTFRHEIFPDAALEQRVSYVWHRVAHLLHRILCDLSRAGYIDVDVWNPMIDDAMALPKDDQRMDQIISLMRLFRYYPIKGFASEHVDVGLLTLCVGDERGLQVLDRLSKPPRWIDVAGPVILVGDIVRSLFNDRARAGLHRVVGNPKGRSSFVFALRPCLKGTIDLSKFGGQGIVSTREHFYKIRGAKYNVNAIKNIREEQQEKQEQQKKQEKLNAVSTSSFEDGQG